MLRLKKKEKKITYKIRGFFLNKEKIKMCVVTNHWRRINYLIKGLENSFWNYLVINWAIWKKNNDIKLHWNFFYAMVMMVLLIRIRHFS
jgi:hypothetical protein